MGPTGGAGRLVAVVMLLLALGAGTPVSAGSAHPRPGAAAADDARMAGPQSAHEHHHGNEWAPTLHKRLRPVAVVGVVPARPTAAVVFGEESRYSIPPPVGDVLARLGVLRV
jgi:hypothetical protein